jgi:hypothetical protein
MWTIISPGPKLLNDGYRRVDWLSWSNDPLATRGDLPQKGVNAVMILGICAPHGVRGKLRKELGET